MQIVELEKMMPGGPLSSERKLSCWLSSAVAQVDRPLLADVIRRHARVGIPLDLTKEIILQSYLFCGFPPVIESLIVFQEVIAELNMTDTNYTETRDLETMKSDGLGLCRQIYGHNFEKLSANMKRLSTDLFDWMIVEGYGKVISRPVMKREDRELCIVSSLATLNHPRQLTSHVLGCRHLGLPTQTIKQSIEILEPILKPSIFSQALTTCITALDTQKGRCHG